MSHQYSDALRSLVPKAKLSIMNEDYDTLQWDESNTDTKPTKAELDAEIKRLDRVYLTNRYQRQRTNDISERMSGIQTSYPKIGEQLDKLWHDIDEGKLDKNGEFYKYIKNVKDTFPKP